LISSLAVERTLSKNDLLLRAGDICRHKIFIMKGLLRTITVKEDGTRYILQFSQEHTWTVDAESYDLQQPSKHSINAVEPTEVLLWSKSDFDTLLLCDSVFKKFAEQVISRNSHFIRQRLVMLLSGTPEEKYKDFIENYPGLLTRLPLHMIASYLGISVKTLTRLRRRLLQRF
jgi:CRP/FNR family transcriptional regulator